MAKCNIDRTYYSALHDLHSAVGAHNLTGAQLTKVSRISSDMINVLRSGSEIDERGSDFSTVRREALTYLYMFNDSELINDAIELLNKVEYFSDESYDYAMFTVLSHAIKSKTGAYKVPAKVIVPAEFRKTSSVFMTHELIHMLKERNDLECKDMINYGEVLPMLIELIIAFSYEYENTENILAKRSESIKVSARCFKELFDEYKSNAMLGTDKATLAALDESGAYINSFYYTLALFSLYLRDSNYMLNMIANVLNCRMTTRDLITYTVHNSYDLYQDGLSRFNSSL